MTGLPEKGCVPCESHEVLEQQSELIERTFGISLGDKRANTPQLKSDIANRLKMLKQQVAVDFETNVLQTIATHEISSPIEQIFLMEWRFARVEEQFRLRLKPQQQVRTDAGTYQLDYCITSVDNPAHHFAVGIELDGHEFHEKTVEQVRNDKRRERAILRAGATKGLVVFRFSGSEIFRNCQSCIRELIDYIEQRFVS